MNAADIETRHLLALRAVAEEGTFARAASRLGFTQSAISQQIAAFERSVGTPLFDRPGGPKAVELTPAGTLLLTHARTVLDQLDRAASELGALLSGEAGPLTVGTFQSVSVKIVPPVIRRLREEAPGVEVRLFESDDVNLLHQRLESGDLDLTFTVFPDELAGFDRVEIGIDHFVVLTRREGHEQDDGRPLPMARLLDEPLIGQEELSCQLLIDEGLRNAGIDPQYVFRSNDNGAVQALVRAGMGRAILAELAIDPTDPEVIVQHLDPPLPARHIDLLRKTGRTLPPAADRFIAIAQEVAAGLFGAAAAGRLLPGK